MAPKAEWVREELAALMDSFTGAMNRVVSAYAEQRDRDRDIYWLALQAAKEYGAIRTHFRIMMQKAIEMHPFESIRKSSQDAYEELEHYYGYRQILDWYLEGEPCPVPYWWDYGDFGEAFNAGPGIKKSLWPEHYGYVEMARRLSTEAGSPWVVRVIRSNREGAAVSFHYVFSKLPATDEYLKRVTQHERAVAEDELHHGPELIEKLARQARTEEEVAEAVEKLTDLRVQELRQRNEQFKHPLSAAEFAALESDFRQKRIEPIPLFSVGMTA